MKKYLLIILLIGLWSCVDEETDNSINFSASVDFSELETIINVAYCPIEISATRLDNPIPNLRFWVRGNIWYEFIGVIQEMGDCHIEVEYPPIADDCSCIDDGNQNTFLDGYCDCFIERVSSFGYIPNTPISEDEFLELWNLSSLEKIGNDCYHGGHWANDGQMAKLFFSNNTDTDENGIYSTNLSIGKSMVGRTLKIEIFWYDDEKEEMDSQIIDIPIVNAN